jgi:hypothetical protein
MTTVYLDPNQVPANLRNGYAGRKFQASVCETVTVPMTAGLWDGGSRDVYSYIRLSDGAAVEMPGQRNAPDSSRSEVLVTLVPGYAVVRHSRFQGQDMGLTFYIHPDNAATMLPAPSADLAPHEKLVLIATRSLKSSYGGRDRYQMAADEYSCRQALGDSTYPTREQWDAAKAALISRGYLNKAGAITPAGRNAAH